jgi:integrase
MILRRSVFEDALNDELIVFNPFERISLDKLLKESTKASDYVVDPYTAEEPATLITAARPDEAPMLRFWFGTGLRPGELMALRWATIDWTNRKARIDLSDEALAALIAQKPLTHAAGEHVFNNPRTGKAWTTDAQIRKTLWVPLHERARVRYRNPYQARHTWALGVLTDGANPWYVKDQLGHVDVQLVFSTYGKFIPEDYKAPRAPALRVVGSNDA